MKAHHGWRESIQEKLFMLKYFSEQIAQPPVAAAGKITRLVHFHCQAPQARLVEIAGDFNQWLPFSMQRQPDGSWAVQIQMLAGHHQYKFIVDGKSLPDPEAGSVACNEHNEVVSTIAIN